MTLLRGEPAAPGAVLAPPWHYDPPALDATRDLALGLDAAAAAAAQQLGSLARKLTLAKRAEEAAILEAQALMAQDETLIGEARRRIEGGDEPGAAVLVAAEAVAEGLEQLEDELIAARAADVRDVAERIVRAMRGIETPELTGRCIAVADDLPPSVTAELERALLVGIVLEAGSRTAHAAILARALAIPAVVGVMGVVSAAAEASLVGIDGDSGEVWLDPDDETRDEIHQRVQSSRDRIEADWALRDEPLQTRDGHRLILAANIGGPEEAALAIEGGAEAVGLLRTEFMFMGRSSAPDELSQVDGYRQVFEAFGNRPVVVRLLDLGGDKNIPYLHLPAEPNPFLGVRALRIGRVQPELISTQLRAIYRAGAEVGVEPYIMAPMVADLSDVELYRELVERAVAELDEEGVSRAQSARLGIMVEVPSAVVLADRIAEYVDFFSVGTNDLTQYLLAADRTNPALADRQDAMHPALLRALTDIVAAAQSCDIPVAVCGEMAGDPPAAVVLAGIGIQELSMDVTSFGGVKRALRAVTLDEARRISAACLEAGSSAEARRVVTEQLDAKLQSAANMERPPEVQGMLSSS